MNRKALISDLLLLLLIALACFGAMAVLEALAGLQRPVRIWLRLGASFGFIVVAVSAGGRRSGYGRFILAGLVCGWWGDYWLSYGGWGNFLAGLVAFLVGHVCYATAFYRYGIRVRTAGISFSFLLVFAAILFAWFFPNIPPNLHFWVLLYMLVISGMFALAAGAIGRAGGWAIAGGAGAFWVSDVFVAYIHFFGSTVWAVVCAAMLYLGAQYTLAASIAAVRRGKAAEEQAA